VSDDDDAGGRKKTKLMAVVGIVIASLTFLLTYAMSRGPRVAREEALLRTTTFRPVNHPEPPTLLWGLVAKPYPTGAFWTNLVVRNGDGAIGVYPYGVKTTDAGVLVSYGASRRVVSNVAITDPFASDLQIFSTQSFMGRAVEAYDNVSVTVGYKTASNGKFRCDLSVRPGRVHIVASVPPQLSHLTSVLVSLLSFFFRNTGHIWSKALRSSPWCTKERRPSSARP